MKKDDKYRDERRSRERDLGAVIYFVAYSKTLDLTDEEKSKIAKLCWDISDGTYKNDSVKDLKFLSAYVLTGVEFKDREGNYVPVDPFITKPLVHSRDKNSQDAISRITRTGEIELRIDLSKTHARRINKEVQAFLNFILAARDAINKEGISSFTPAPKAPVHLRAFMKGADLFERYVIAWDMRNKGYTWQAIGEKENPSTQKEIDSATQKAEDAFKKAQEIVEVINLLKELI